MGSKSTVNRQTDVTGDKFGVYEDGSGNVWQGFVLTDSEGNELAIKELGLTELIGINEQVDQDEYGASVGVVLGDTYSGTIRGVAFYSTEDGTGAVQTPVGKLLVLDADPATAAGDAALDAAEWVTVLGWIVVTAADWIADANGGFVYYSDQPIPFHALATLYFVWFHEDAVSFNDVAGDDEQLEFNAWFERKS